MSITIKKPVHYLELLPEDKWKYRRALRSMQQLINDLQTKDYVDLPQFALNPRETTAILRVRHEMLLMSKGKTIKRKKVLSEK